MLYGVRSGESLYYLVLGICTLDSLCMLFLRLHMLHVAFSSIHLLFFMCTITTCNEPLDVLTIQ